MTSDVAHVVGHPLPKWGSGNGARASGDARNARPEGLNVLAERSVTGPLPEQVAPEGDDPA